MGDDPFAIDAARHVSAGSKSTRSDRRQASRRVERLLRSTAEYPWRYRFFQADQCRAHTQARVILALYKAAKKAAIDLPYPTTVMLFHDHSEATDGDRSSQREGWPAGANPPGPRRKEPPEGGGPLAAGHKSDE